MTVFGGIYLGHEVPAFCQKLFSAYENQDISALLLEVCQRGICRPASGRYLIPKRFHSEAGGQSGVAYRWDGNKLETGNRTISSHRWNKYQEILKIIVHPRIKDLSLQMDTILCAVNRMIWTLKRTM